MADKPTQNDPYTLKPFEFQEFVQWFPDAALQKAKIKRGQFVAVAMMLSRHGEFQTGTNIRPSVATLSDESGISEPTVRKVLAYLRAIKVLVITGTHRNQGGGTPVTVYRFSRAQVVEDVIALKDRDVSRGKRETAVTGSGESGEPLMVKRGTAGGQTGNRNRNEDDNELSLAGAPSPAPVVAEPSARSGAAEEVINSSTDDWMDALLQDVGAPSLDL